MHLYSVPQLITLNLEFIGKDFTKNIAASLASYIRYPHDMLPLRSTRIMNSPVPSRSSSSSSGSKKLGIKITIAASYPFSFLCSSAVGFPASSVLNFRQSSVPEIGSLSHVTFMLFPEPVTVLSNPGVCNSVMLDFMEIDIFNVERTSKLDYRKLAGRISVQLSNSHVNGDSMVIMTLQ